MVRDLCGHGVGLAMHEEPEVLHYGHRGTGMLLVPGMTFTIEPMINMGTWKVFIDADDPTDGKSSLVMNNRRHSGSTHSS